MTPRADTLDAGSVAAGVRRDVRRAFADGVVIDMWQAPDGWKLRRYRQPGHAGEVRGSLLFLSGRGDFLEKYSETLDAMAWAGWDVTAFDWRGQGGSGRLSDADPWVGHCETFGPWLDDLQTLYREWTAQGQGPHVVIAHSMGANLLLRAMMERDVRPDAAVLVAPMLGLKSAPFPDWLARRIVTIANYLGLSGRGAWKDVTSTSPRRMAQRRARLTHSIERHDDELWWRQQKPALALGGPSWHWLEEAYGSVDRIQSGPEIETLDVPILILATSGDRLVSAEATQAVARRLPDARLHLYGEEAAHEILREVDDVRDDAMARIEAFLDERAPAR